MVILKIPENFRIQQQDNEVLITPEFATGNSCWKDWNHRWLRSLHLDANTGYITSSGFPRFGNLNEGVGKYQVTIENLYMALKNGLLATLKLDGSMLVRFVQNNQVKWRTRGSLTVGLDNKHELDEFIKKYPMLDDPSRFDDISLLFEWSSPENQIVIKYEKPEIHLIGGVIYEKNIPWYKNKIRLLQWEDLQNISKIIKVPLTESFDLKTSKDIDNLIESIKHDKKIEGFVLRFDDDQRMVKIKSDHYLVLHALKSRLTTSLLIDLCLEWSRPNYLDYQQKFIDSFDYECFVFARPAISSMFDGIKSVNSIYNHIEKFVQENKNINRKNFAELAKQKYSDLKLAMCFMLFDSKVIGNNFWKKVLLQNCKQYELKMFHKGEKSDYSPE